MKRVSAGILLFFIVFTLLSLCGCNSNTDSDSSSNVSMMTDSEYESANSLASQILNSTSSKAQVSSSQAQNKQTEKIVDSNGKTIWKVYCSPTWYQYIHFSSTYKGKGNFIIKVLDSNQDLYAIVANEIGDYVLDKTVNAPPLDDKGYFYIEQDITDGSTTGNWNCSNTK